MSLFNRIFLGQKIDEWASDYTLLAARTLNQVAIDLNISADEEIVKVSLKDGLRGQAIFIQNLIEPRVRALAELVAREILDDANAALLKLVDEQAVWVRGQECSQRPDGAFDGARDVAMAAVPLAAGVAAIAVLPLGAVATTTAWFGLVTTTVISWPVVVGGGALAGLGLATGVINAAKIRIRAQARLRDRVRRFIVASLIEGSEKSPAILQQLTAEFDRAAKRAKAL